MIFSAPIQHRRIIIKAEAKCGRKNWSGRRLSGDSLSKELPASVIPSKG